MASKPKTPELGGIARRGIAIKGRVLFNATLATSDSGSVKGALMSSSAANKPTHEAQSSESSLLDGLALSPSPPSPVKGVLSPFPRLHKRRRLVDASGDDESYRPTPHKQSSRRVTSSRMNSEAMMILDRPRRVRSEPGKYTLPPPDTPIHLWPTTQGTVGFPRKKGTPVKHDNATIIKGKGRQKDIRQKSSEGKRADTLRPDTREGQVTQVAGTTISQVAGGPSRISVRSPRICSPQQRPRPSEVIFSPSDNSRRNTPVILLTTKRPTYNLTTGRDDNRTRGFVPNNSEKEEDEQVEPEDTHLDEITENIDLFEEFADFDYVASSPDLPKHPSPRVVVDRQSMANTPSKESHSVKAIVTPGTSDRAQTRNMSNAVRSSKSPSTAKVTLVAQVLADAEEHQRAESEAKELARVRAQERLARLKRQMDEEEDDENEEEDEDGSFFSLSQILRDSVNTKDIQASLSAPRRSTRIHGGNISQFEIEDTAHPVSSRKLDAGGKAFNQLVRNRLREEALGITGAEVERALASLKSPHNQSLSSDLDFNHSSFEHQYDDEFEGSVSQFLDLSPDVIALCVPDVADIGKNELAIEVEALRAERIVARSRDSQSVGQQQSFWLNGSSSAPVIKDDIQTLPVLPDLDDPFIHILRSIQNVTELAEVIGNGFLRLVKYQNDIALWLLQLTFSAVDLNLSWTAAQQLVNLLVSASSNPLPPDTVSYFFSVWSRLGAALEVCPVSRNQRQFTLARDRQESSILICTFTSVMAKRGWLGSETARDLLASLMVLAIDPTTSDKLSRSIIGSSDALIPIITNQIGEEALASFLVNVMVTLPISFQAKSVFAFGRRNAQTQAVVGWLAKKLVLTIDNIASFGEGTEIDACELGTPMVEQLALAVDIVIKELDAEAPDYNRASSLLTLLSSSVYDIEAIVADSFNRGGESIEVLRSALVHARNKIHDTSTNEIAASLKGRLGQMGHVVRLRREMALSRLRATRFQGTNLVAGGSGQTRLSFDKKT